MKNYRHITTPLLALAGALAASGCDRAGSADATAKAAAAPTITDFNGWITDFACLKSKTRCDHSHFCVGDDIAVAKDGGKYRFKSKKHDTGAEIDSELTYANGLLRGTVGIDHHGTQEPHWLILVPPATSTAPWKITICDTNPQENDSCPEDEDRGELHAGYGHADD